MSKETTISKTVHVGDASTPFDVDIDVIYEETDKEFIVTYWMEDSSPYDNPPAVWIGTLEEVITDYFWDINKEKKTVFNIK